MTTEIDGMKSSISKFEVLVHNKKLFDRKRDIEIFSEFSRLNIKLNSIKNKIDFIEYDIKKRSEAAKKDADLVEKNQENTENKKKSDAKTNMEHDMLELEGIMSKIATAFKNDNYTSIIDYSLNIKSISYKMNNDNNTVNSPNLVQINSILKSMYEASEEMADLAKDGHHKHHELHHEHDQIKKDVALLKKEIDSLN